MSPPEDKPSGESGRDLPDRAARVRGLLAVLDPVTWALLRPASSLDDSGDIDLLVAGADLDRAVAALESAGFARLDFGDPDDAHLVTHDGVGFHWAHVQTRVRAPGITLDSSILLGAIADREGLPVVADEWLFWVLAVHTLCETGRVSLRHRAGLHASVSRAHTTAELVRGHFDEVGIDVGRLLDLVEAQEWSDVESLGDGLPRPVPLTERLRGRLVGVRRMGRCRGVSVAALGPDGAGKTTLISGLETTLPFPTSRVYLGLTGGRLPLADRLRLPGIVFLARLLLLWTRHAVVVVQRRRGRFVLLDRHVLDGRVPSGVTIGPLRRRARRLESHLVPVPDVLVVLDAPGRLLFERSREYDPVTLEGWRVAYREIAAGEQRAVLVDATRPPEEVLAAAQDAVWRAWRDRLHR